MRNNPKQFLPRNPKDFRDLTLGISNLGFRIFVYLTFIYRLLTMDYGLSYASDEKGGPVPTAKTIIELPAPKLKSDVSLEEAIYKRRSKRSFSQRDLSLEQVSRILWSCQGMTDERRGFRAAPSPGALYPLEIYAVKQDGLFHYIPDGHKLELVSREDLRARLSNAAWGQDFIREAPLDIVICAVYSRVTSKYGQRGIRYADIEVGHAAQNIQLEAVSLGLVSCVVGAFDSKGVSELLNLSKDEEPLYIIPVGYSK